MKKTLLSVLFILLFVSQSSLSTAQSYQIQNFQKTKVDLNVRFQPKLGNNRIDHLKKNTPIKVKKNLGKWCQIEFKKYPKAYVNCSYLTSLETKPVTNPNQSISGKSLSPEAKRILEYNNQLVLIWDNAREKIFLLGSSIKITPGGDINKEFAEKIIPLFPKIGVILQEANEKSSAIQNTPSDAKQLLESVKNIYDIDQQLFEKLTTALQDISFTKEVESSGLKAINKITSELSEQEQKAIKDYNAYAQKLAKKYDIDPKEMKKIN